jgi:uncharacterized LabA/DUF88 family protein
VARPNPRSFAFIDANNLHLGVKAQGWKVDWGRFRRYLAEKYGVGEALLFIGYLPEREDTYRRLEILGYKLVFKPAVRDAAGKVKANIDADLVLAAARRWDEYDHAVLVSSDGDFYSLVRAWREEGKLLAVLSPGIRASHLLNREAGSRLFNIGQLRLVLERRP